MKKMSQYARVIDFLNSDGKNACGILFSGPPSCKKMTKMSKKNNADTIHYHILLKVFLQNAVESFKALLNSNLAQL